MSSTQINRKSESATGNANGTTSARVVDYLRTLIADGSLAPNSQLNEAELADRLEVSRTPIREAFRELARMGLVVSRPNRGTFVRSLSTKELVDVYAIRSVLEGLATRLATEHCDAVGLHTLTDLNEQMNAAARHGDVEAFVNGNFSFHRVLYGYSHNAILESLIANLIDRVPISAKARWLSVDKALGAVREHTNILHALTERQGAEGEMLMRRHIRWEPHIPSGPGRR